MLDYLIKVFRARAVRKQKGVLIFYMVYEPQKPVPNVFNHCLDPDIMQDKELNELLKQVAEKVRLYYEEKPELLAEIMKVLEEQK